MIAHMLSEQVYCIAAFARGALAISAVIVEHEMRVVARSDWVIDFGPGAGDEGGRLVASGPPLTIADCESSRTAADLRTHCHLR